jgi:hypothetical protein
MQIGLDVGDYLQIGNEILRIKSTIIGNQVYIFRGLLGTRSTPHLAGTVVRKILLKPIEFRRNSIIRASGHTFEYVGFGPGNYSTALPDKQDRKLSTQENILSQSTKVNGGLTVFTGMNDSGDFYIGNKKISSATGQEEVFDTPIPSVTGEELDIGGVDVGFDVITPLEVSITRSINVEGGNNNSIISKFNGPVVFNNKITSNSPKGIEANTLYLQGDVDIARKYTVGISTPINPGTLGDVVYNAEPVSGETVGWVYTKNNAWEQFGKISENNIIDNTIRVLTYGNLQGTSAAINFVGTGGIDVLSSFDPLTATSNLTFKATITDPATLSVAGIATFNGPVTFNSDITINPPSTLNVGNANFSGNIILGNTTKTTDTFVRVLSGDNNNAGLEADGNTQGTGYL